MTILCEHIITTAELQCYQNICYVYEQVALDLFVSPGSICLLPYVLNDPQDESKMAELVQQLSKKVMTLVSKVRFIVDSIVVVNLVTLQFILTLFTHKTP